MLCSRVLITFNKLSFYNFKIVASSFSSIHDDCLSRVAKTFLDGNGQLKQPTYFNFASEVIDKWAYLEEKGARKTVQPALWYVDMHGNELKWNFKDVSKMSMKSANVLVKDCNLGIDDRLVVLLPNTPEWWIIKLAASRNGTLFSPGTVQLSPKDIEYRLTKLKATGIVTDAETASKVDTVTDRCPTLKTKILVDPSASLEFTGWLNFNNLLSKASSEHECVPTKREDPFCIYFTSGTTGNPKMVIHTHGSFGLGLINDCRYWMRATENDLIWCNADPAWGKAAHTRFYIPWLSGAGVFVHQMPRFDPKILLKALRDYPITQFYSVPTTYRLLLSHSPGKIALSPTLRQFKGGGEAMTRTLLAQWEENTGFKILEGYGQTEMAILCAMYESLEFRAGSMGKPIPGVNLTVLNDDGQEAASDEEGEIVVKIKPHPPPNLFKGYLDDPEKTAEVMRGEYYHTGDRGYKDKDGYFWFVGRHDDVIISAGYRIGPFEVENALNEDPAVRESAVVSSPDPERGEVVKAYIVLAEGFKPSDQLASHLQDHVKSLTAPYKYPRKIEFVETLPKTITGKIRRNVLREKEWKKQFSY